MSDEGSKRSPGAGAPYPLSRLSAKVDLIDMAREIQAADSLLSAVAAGKLESIARQIRALQQEAARTLEEARLDAELHRASCNFKKIPGKIYHLYRRTPSEPYFSQLSPDDWGGKPPHAYVGSFRLEADMRFTAASEIADREREWSELRPLLGRPSNSE